MYFVAEISRLTSVTRLDSPTDPRLAPYANLHAKASRVANAIDEATPTKLSLQAEYFVVEGRWCVDRLLQSDHHVESLLVQEGKDLGSITKSLSPETPVYTLPADRIRELVGFDFHRGMMACGIRPRPMDAERSIKPIERAKLALAVLGVTEHENLGSILRSASALGIQNVLIGAGTIDPYARRTIRVSMGTVFGLTLYRLDRPRDQLLSLRKAGIRTLVTTLATEATPLSEFQASREPAVLIVGNEAFGVAPEIQSLATDRVTIPMKLGTDSLNVSVAAAICMYELSKCLREGA